MWLYYSTQLHEYCLVDSYDWLVNGMAQAQVETLMEEEHSFDEYIEVSLCLIQYIMYTNVQKFEVGKIVLFYVFKRSLMLTKTASI